MLRPLVRGLAKLGVTANQITLLAMFLSIIVGSLLLFNPKNRIVFFLIPVFLFIRMALNAIDGMLAREHNMKSALGAILNELGDVVSDTALYLPFAFVPGFPNRWILAIVILAIFSEMAGILGVVIGASRRYDGPMGKSDRAFVFGLISLLFALGVPMQSWIQYVFIAIALLIFITILQRVRKAIKEVS